MRYPTDSVLTGHKMGTMARSRLINFITSQASNKCQREKRKTINGDNLRWAITTLGFIPFSHFLVTHHSPYLHILFYSLSLCLSSFLPLLSVSSNGNSPQDGNRSHVLVLSQLLSCLLPFQLLVKHRRVTEIAPKPHGTSRRQYDVP